MSIYVCGDTHSNIDLEKLTSKKFPEGKKLTKKDFLIILGDFGLVWAATSTRKENYYLNWINEKPWTTLVIPGNHENYDRLFSDEFPTIDFGGSTVRKIRNSIYLLNRGDIYTIENKTIFTIGGGLSIDKSRREEYISWWRQEMPSMNEYWRGLEAMKQKDFNVDYILTHSCSHSTFKKLQSMFDMNHKVDEGEKPLRDYLEWIEQDSDYKEWHFGHFHIDSRIDDRHWCHYNESPQKLGN